MPVIGVGRTIGIVLEHGNSRNFRVVLINGVWDINFTKMLGQLDMLGGCHLLISKKHHLVCHECVVDGLCALSCDVA